MRLAVIGTGVMGRNHARVAATHHELAAVVDADAEMGARVGASHGAPAFSSLAELVKSGVAVDGVVIATPTKTHEALTIQALDAGWDVLVEKPIAVDSVAAGRMIAHAAKAGRTLAVGQIERHNPVVAFAKQALTEGQYGRPITLGTRRVSRFPGRIHDVGCILDIGIHDIDVLNYLANGTPTSVYALGGTHQAQGGLEDHANLLLRYGSGLMGTVEVNWLTPHKVRRLSLTCDDAFVECDYMDQAVTVSRSRFTDAAKAPVWPVAFENLTERIDLTREEPLRRELDDFVTACQNGVQPLADGQVGLAALATAEAALKSLASGKPEAPSVPDP